METAIDVVSIGFSAYDMYQDPSWENAGWLALDIICAAVPFVPAVGAVRHAGKIKKLFKASDKVADVAKAADEASDVAGVARKVPNPHGRKGGLGHQRKVNETYERAKVNHPDREVVKEGRINTPGGQKGHRYGDVVVRKGGRTEKVYQVGNTLADGVTPVSRERKAVGDILRQNISVEFIPKD